MAITLESALDRIRERAEDDPQFAEAVVNLAESDLNDPFDRVDGAVLEVTRAINRRRQDVRERRSMAGRWPVDR